MEKAEMKHRRLKLAIPLATIVLLASCGSETVVPPGEQNPDVQAVVPSIEPRIESVRIESMANGVAQIEMELEQTGGVSLYFDNLDSDLSPALVSGSWVQEGSNILVEFEDTDLYLNELFCNYPACDDGDELILSDDGTLRYRAIMEDDTLHDTLYVWGVMCGAEYVTRSN